LPEEHGRIILRSMQRSPTTRGILLALALAGALSTASLACLSSSNTKGSNANGDAGELGPDSGAGCSSQILSRCTYATGVCFEYSGPSIGDAGDPYDCVNSEGTLENDGQGCTRTGTEGSCVVGAGIGIVNGKPCDYYLTTWLPGGYDSGAPGEPCKGVPGTFTPN
jgi:hypothetical protein